MRRSTLYSATSCVLSLTAHAAAVLALARMGPVQAAKGTDSNQSREILLLPPATPTPAARPVPPPPEVKPPAPEPRPVPPPPEDPAAVLGVDDGDDRSKNWLGANKETPHSGPKADQDQAQFTPAPGVASVGTSAPGAAPQRPTPEAPPAPKPVAPTPQVQPAPATLPDKPAPQDLPAAPPSARKVVASPEHPEEKDVLQDDQPTPGLHEPAPRQGAEQAPKKNAADESKKVDPSPAGELPAPIPGARPDGSSESTTPARQAAAPAAAPKPPEDAQIDPSATPNSEGDAKSTIEKKENSPAAPNNAADPQAPLAPAPDKLPEQSRPPDDAARDPFQPAPDELPEPPVPPSEPETAPSVELLPQVPGEQGPEGATSAGDRPGIESDRESDAAAIKVVRADRFGKPLAAKGLNIQTVRPRWTTTTTLTTSPKNPIVRIRFRRDGTVSEAKFVDGNSTGYQDVDDPLLDAIHRWRAKGKQLDDLPPGDRKGLVLVMKIQLR